MQPDCCYIRLARAANTPRNSPADPGPKLSSRPSLTPPPPRQSDTAPQFTPGGPVRLYNRMPEGSRPHVPTHDSNMPLRTAGGSTP